MHRSRLLCLAAILVALSLFATLSVRAQDAWSLRASGTAQNLWGVAYGNNSYVAVGEAGTILRSPDGSAWTSVVSGSTNWLLSATYGHGQWIVVGDAGLVLTSPDAQIWTAHSITGAPRLNAVITTPVGYVTAGEAGKRYYSADGKTWTVLPNATFGGSPVWQRGLVYDEGFVRSSGEAGYIGSDANWQSGNYKGTVTFDNDVPVALTNPVEGLAVANGTRVAVGHGGVIQTARRTFTWRQRPSGTSAGLRAVTAFRGRFLAVGDNGTLLRSETGETWSALNSGSTQSLVAITPGAQGVVVVGYQGTILQSTPANEAPVLVRQPTNVNEIEGGYVALEARATGTEPLSYLWRHDGVPVTGATGPFLSLSKLTPSDAGNYTVEISNAQGSATSRAASVIVTPTATTYSPVDATFQTGGFAADGRALLVLPDDRILVGSNTTTSAAATNSPGVFRLGANGQPDSTFNVGTGLGTGGTIHALARQSDGRILVGGSFTSWNGTPANSLVRLLADGQLDGTFTPPTLAANESILTLQVLPDDRIIAGKNRVLLANGQPDPTFNAPAYTEALLPRADGGFLAVIGGADFNSITGYEGSVALLNAFGGVESVTSNRFNFASIHRLIRLADGRVLAAYRSFSRPLYYRRLALWQADGTADRSFAPIAISELSSSVVVSEVQYLPSRGQIALLYALSPTPISPERRVVLFDLEGHFQAQYVLSSNDLRYPFALAKQSGDRLIVAGQLSLGGTIFRLASEPPAGVQPPQVVAVTPSQVNVEDGQPWRVDAIIAGSSPITFSRLPTSATLDGPFVSAARASSTDAGIVGVKLSSPSARLGEADRPSLAFVDVGLRELAFAAEFTDRTVRRNRPFTLSVNVTGSGPLRYRWTLNGVTVQDLSLPTLTINEATATNSGKYQVIVTGPTGTIVSREAFVAIGPFAYIKNLSTRAKAGEATDNLIVGFVLDGPTVGSDLIYVRGIGPGLAAFGVPDPLPRPYLRLYRGTTLHQANIGWNQDPALKQATTDFGAFPLNEAGTDAALLWSTQPGAYTATLTNSPQYVTGNGLVEVYHRGRAAPWLTNVSSRAKVGQGDNIMIAGLVIEGSGTYPYLIRGIGPALNDYGVTDTLADPVLEIVNTATGQTIAINDNWDAARAADFAAAGAFALTPGSKDAALRLNLPPGRYTALLRGVNNTTGVGLIEIYELP